MTYAEFLRSQGASDEDVKILDTAIGRKAFDAQQAAVAAEAARLKAESDAAIADYKKKADDWYNDVAQPNLTKAQQDATKAAAEAARLRSLVASSTDEGLKAVAKEMGYTVDGAAAAADADKNKNNPGASGFDPNKYFTRDDIVAIAEREGDAIAVAQDIAYEHRVLFPDRPLNFRELRKEAVAAKKPVEQFWMEKFGVAAARDKRAAEAKAADEARIRKEERDKVTAEMADKYGNPNLATPSVSSNVFVPRPASGRDKAPWEAGIDGANGSNDRTARATKVFMEKQGSGARTN